MEAPLSTEKQNHVLQLLKLYKGDYKEVARHTLVPASVIKEIDIIKNKKHNFTEEGRGPKHLQKYLVARTRTHIAWDNENNDIKQAREKVDQGKATMCTGRDGMYLLLYCFPKKVVELNPKPYFILEEE